MLDSLASDRRSVATSPSHCIWKVHLCKEVRSSEVKSRVGRQGPNQEALHRIASRVFALSIFVSVLEGCWVKVFCSWPTWRLSVRLPARSVLELLSDAVRETKTRPEDIL
jgi:hypothetical protein